MVLHLLEGVNIAFVAKPQGRVYLHSNWPNSKQLVSQCPQVGSKAAADVPTGALKTKHAGIPGCGLLAVGQGTEATLTAQCSQMLHLVEGLDCLELGR